MPQHIPWSDPDSATARPQGGPKMIWLYKGGGNLMMELMRVSNPVLLSALKAAFAAERIEVFEFDGPIADLYAGDFFPRRLMVHEDDLLAARDVAAELCPELLPALPDGR
jgi:hypothetical protein